MSVKIVSVDNYHNKMPCHFHVFSKDIMISKVLSNNLVWEPHMHKIFERYINKDSIVIEAGSHIGSHTIKLGLLAKTVYAFEPLPSTHKLLCDNITMNHIDNVIPILKGLSDKPGETVYDWLNELNTGCACLADNPVPSLYHSNVNINVVLTSIDEMKLEKLDFIKIDVEGYERLVINGALETIIKCKPVITIESWLIPGSTWSTEHTTELYKDLLDIGYLIYHINGPDFLFIPNF